MGTSWESWLDGSRQKTPLKLLDSLLREAENDGGIDSYSWRCMRATRSF